MTLLVWVLVKPRNGVLWQNSPQIPLKPWLGNGWHVYVQFICKRPDKLNNNRAGKILKIHSKEFVKGNYYFWMLAASGWNVFSFKRMQIELREWCKKGTKSKPKIPKVLGQNKPLCDGWVWFSYTFCRLLIHIVRVHLIYIASERQNCTWLSILCQHVSHQGYNQAWQMHENQI